MNLKRGPYPNPIGNASYFYIQAGHRETAIDQAIQVIRDDAARAAPAAAAQASLNVVDTTISDWVVETLIQGAWLREYHEWEKATKSYFDIQHERNGSKTKPKWKGKLSGADGAVSHVTRVRIQLELFAASIPDTVLHTIDSNRDAINRAKHDDEYFVTEEDFRALHEAISDFWNDLAKQEEFSAR